MDGINTFISYLSWEEIFDELPDADLATLTRVVFRYARTGEVPEGLSLAVRVAFAPIRSSIDLNRAKWDETRKKRSEAGRAGGLATQKQNQANQANAYFASIGQAKTGKVKQDEANQAVTKTVTKTVTKNVTVTDIDTPLPPKAGGRAEVSVDEQKNFEPILSEDDADDEEEALNEGCDEKSCPSEKLREKWNAVCTPLQPVRGVHGKRARTLQARWKEHPDLDWWEDYFRKIEASDFLTGRSSKWKTTFDWCLSAGNMDKILEGNYDNKDGKEIRADGEDPRDTPEYWTKKPVW